MNICLYTSNRAKEIVDLFHQSVHAIDSSIYSPEQKEAWAPTPPDYAKWAERLLIKQPFIAIIDNKVVGFIELDPDGHIDCTYTHPKLQGKGVATKLYKYLEKEAKNKQINRLYVEASIVAKPFFEKQGFAIVKENRVQRNGVTLTNYTMEKYLQVKNR